MGEESCEGLRRFGCACHTTGTVQNVCTSTETVMVGTFWFRTYGYDTRIRRAGVCDGTY